MTPFVWTNVSTITAESFVEKAALIQNQAKYLLTVNLIWTVPNYIKQEKLN